MDCFSEGSASIMIPGGRNAQFTSQRVIIAEDNIPPYPGYSPISAIKNDLRKNRSCPEISVRGVISDKLSREVLTNTRIEVWHRSAKGEGEYLRARITTDNYGQYHFHTDWPEREKGKNYSIFFKITYGRTIFFTKMCFNHALALLSSINKDLKPHNPLPGTATLTPTINLGTSFKFNIDIPVNIKDLIRS
jgi:hypothetical protein